MHIQGMEFYKQALKGLQDLNTALRSEGDSARVRYVSFEPDYDYADSWIVLVTWEVPEPCPAATDPQSRPDRDFTVSSATRPPGAPAPNPVGALDSRQPGLP